MLINNTQFHPIFKGQRFEATDVTMMIKLPPLGRFGAYKTFFRFSYILTNGSAMEKNCKVEEEHLKSAILDTNQWACMNSTEFNQELIDFKRTCDGQPDCLDGSDEKGCKFSSWLVPSLLCGAGAVLFVTLFVFLYKFSNFLYNLIIYFKNHKKPSVSTLVCSLCTASVSKLGGRNFACSLHS